MSTKGEGRLCLLWHNSGYSDYEEFCLGEPNKIREMRRVFLLACGWFYRRHSQYLNSDSFAVTLAGDVEANPDTLDTFLRKWDQKKHCCVPSGICKDLKRQGITAEDLQKPEWKCLMYNAASMLQLSMADVEAMHSRNRVLARSAFHTISSKFINRESQCFMEEASELQDPPGRQVSCSNSKATTTKDGGLVIVEPKQKTSNCKGQSPLEIFRKRFLQQKRLLESVNPCSKEVWEEVKTKFDELSPDEKSVYEKMSQESMTAAVHARGRKIALKNAGTALQVTASKEQQVREAPAVHTQILPLWKLCQVLSDDHASVDRVAAAVGKHMSSPQAIAKSNFPLSESTLEAAFRGLSSNGITGKAAESKFHLESERIARPPANDIFPSRVVHEGVCGELCRHFADPRQIGLHQGTAAIFNSIVTRKGGVKSAVISDPLCDLATSW